MVVLFCNFSAPSSGKFPYEVIFHDFELLEKAAKWMSKLNKTI